MKKKARKKTRKKMTAPRATSSAPVQIVNVRVNSDGGNDADKKLNRMQRPIY